MLCLGLSLTVYQCLPAMQIKLDSVDKNNILSSHNFRMEQTAINYRLLFSPQEKRKRVESAVSIYESNVRKNFNPDFNDEGTIANNTLNTELIFQEQLEHMESAFILSSAVDVFHIWEKSLKEWLYSQLQHKTKDKTKLQKYIWKETTSNLIDILMCQSNLNHHQKALLRQIEELLTVANAYKHGEGGSFEKLKAQYPKYLSQSPHKYMQIIPSVPNTQYNDLHMSIAQYESFGKTIDQFWEELSLSSSITIHLNAKLTKDLLKALN